MSKNKKILFLHGFFASGQCIPALALRQAFQGTAEVLTPDLPQHPAEALRLVREICASEHPDVLVGNSCGAFYAQMVASAADIPALLGNPHFQMTDFLRPRIGAHQFKSPRADGRQQFVIDEPLINLDPVMQRKVKDFLKSYTKDGRTVFISTHILENAQEICDSFAVLHKGSLLYTGSVAELNEKGRKLDDLFLELVNRA